MFHVILIVIPIALVAKVRLAQEPFVRIIVTIFLDQPDDLVGRDWSLIDDHVCWVDRHDFDLISRECCLKLLQFWNTARTFRNSCQWMQRFSLLLLDRITLLESVIIPIPGVIVCVHQCLHDHNGPCAAQFVPVLDGCPWPFDDPEECCFVGSVPLTVPTPRTWDKHEGDPGWTPGYEQYFQLLLGIKCWTHNWLFPGSSKWLAANDNPFLWRK